MCVVIKTKMHIVLYLVKIWHFHTRRSCPIFRQKYPKKEIAYQKWSYLEKYLQDFEKQTCFWKAVDVSFDSTYYELGISTSIIIYIIQTNGVTRKCLECDDIWLSIQRSPIYIYIYIYIYICDKRRFVTCIAYF